MFHIATGMVLTYMILLREKKKIIGGSHFVLSMKFLGIPERKGLGLIGLVFSEQ